MKDYFSEEPFGCRDGCGLVAFDPAVRRILNEVREELGIPLIIESGCRCEKHNAAVGGAAGSAHLRQPDGLCHAVDIRVFNPVVRGRLLEALQKRGIRRFEVSNKHLHADNSSYHMTPLLEATYFKG